MHLGFWSMNTLREAAPDRLAVALEQAGFESLWYGEHSHIPLCRATPYPAGGPLPEPYWKMMDPYVSLMAAAAATTRLKLGTGIALLLERELLSQAKTIVTLDRLSDGRVLLGAGVGWNEEEFANASSYPWRRRYSAVREVVAAQRRLFTEAEPEYHGEHVDFDPLLFEPKPLQAGGPPVILGVMGVTGMRHAAAWADGWMPADVALPDPAGSIALFRGLLEEQGRRPEDAPITVVCMSPPSADFLRRLRDLEVARATLGVPVADWGKADAEMRLIERYQRLMPELAG